ncbi:peptidoglycan DD-metalloendopeptidase family protein [Nitratireductor luteus]|uniref:peptidoglycan DD-metalloendopeptidase family protein n=1 Tax=Nitratireductor luteus TaxID=2976980 RepID=UPI00223F5404|nr:peptidoglycan DD-metalloendopeptidase family protein [Nitratireductor luteus]
MRFGITGQFKRSLARGAAVLVMGGVAAGCSGGGAAQLTDGLVTNSTSTVQSSAPAYQAYPGDVGAPTARRTADGGLKVIRPRVDVGGGAGPANNVSNLPAPAAPASAPVYTPPSAARSEIVSQPLPAPQQSSASAPRQQPENTFMDTVAPRRQDAAAPAEPAPQPTQPRQVQAAAVPQAPKPKAEDKDRAGAQPAASNGAYTVVSGDTLYGISRKTGISVDRLKQENGLSDGTIRIGQTLKIPSGTGSDADQIKSVSAPTSHSTPKEEEPRQVSTYTPPKDSDDVADKAVSEEKVAAITPDATGVDRLRWPVRGRVVTGFGANAGGRNSDGIDIAVPEGTSVRAAENGVVIYAGDGLKGFGNTVLVRHEDGLVTVYGHASDIKVKRGDKVTRGQEVALSGMSGDADRPKLHFEVRKGTSPVDPTEYLE